MNEPPFSAVDRWEGGWDEAALREWAEGLRRRLGSRPVTFGLLFTTPPFFRHARDLLELVRVHAQVPVLAGCSSHGLVAGGRESESGGGLVLGLYSIPGATVRAWTVPVVGAGAEENGPPPAPPPPPPGISGWLAFLEPFHTDAESWLAEWQAASPGVPVYGGLAAGQADETRAQLFCNGEVVDRGGVVLCFEGVRLLGMVAQGCTPVGETWTITRVDGNVVQRIGNRPAFAVLEETFEGFSDDVKTRSRGNLFAGLVIDEYRDEFRRGDFLVRSILGGDPNNGAIALGALPRAGQTLQFQLRDGAAADEDLREMLGRLRDELGRSRIYGGCLCTCAGRGRALFGEADHDAALVQQIVGPAAVAGFFCNGEFGPVGPRSFVHSYTAALALFVGPAQAGREKT